MQQFLFYYFLENKKYYLILLVRYILSSILYYFALITLLILRYYIVFNILDASDLCMEVVHFIITSYFTLFILIFLYFIKLCCSAGATTCHQTRYI